MIKIANKRYQNRLVQCEAPSFQGTAWDLVQLVRRTNHTYCRDSSADPPPALLSARFVCCFPDSAPCELRHIFVSFTYTASSKSRHNPSSSVLITFLYLTIMRLLPFMQTQKKDRPSPVDISYICGASKFCPCHKLAHRWVLQASTLPKVSFTLLKETLACT